MQHGGIGNLYIPVRTIEGKCRADLAGSRGRCSSLKRAVIGANNRAGVAVSAATAYSKMSGSDLCFAIDRFREIGY